ncbi:MAG: hypothetical protein PHS44_00230 [Candidatus Dojkabacteria bacterium]|nr:hypothetical protein [Candidatus Dojkabacteria bacterium]
MKTFKKVYIFLDKIPLITTSLVILIFTMLLFLPTDPDLFWHLKYGELTLDQGPISHDPFSYTFSEFRFYDYEWLAHILTILLYRFGGYVLLSIFFAVIVLLAFTLSANISLPRKAPRNLRTLAVFAGLFLTIPMTGIRLQMLSLLGVVSVYFIYNRYLTAKSKLIYLIPVIFVLWANVHPGFLSGLALISLLTFSEFIKFLLRSFNLSGKSDSIYDDDYPSLKTLFLITVLSFISTLITPFGHHILFQSLSFSVEPYTGNIINEWLSPDFKVTSGFFFYSFSGIIFLSFYLRKKINLNEILVIIFFAIMTMQGIRNLPLLVAVALPSILQTPGYQKIKGYFNDANLLLLASKLFLFILALGISIFNFRTYYKLINDIDLVYEAADYPREAVVYMKENPEEGNIFNTFGWGGYLIWEYPEKKLFIDGRMPSWRMGKRSILKEQNDIKDLKIPDWRERLYSYNVKIILLRPTDPLVNALRYDPDWEVVLDEPNSVLIYKKI